MDLPGAESDGVVVVIRVVVGQGLIHVLVDLVA